MKVDPNCINPKRLETVLALSEENMRDDPLLIAGIAILQAGGAVGPEEAAFLIDLLPAGRLFSTQSPGTYLREVKVVQELFTRGEKNGI